MSGQWYPVMLCDNQGLQVWVHRGGKVVGGIPSVTACDSTCMCSHACWHVLRPSYVFGMFWYVLVLHVLQCNNVLYVKYFKIFLNISKDFESRMMPCFCDFLCQCNVDWHILTYSIIFWHILTYSDISWHILTHYEWLTSLSIMSILLLSLYSLYSLYIIV
jgi:hypothetical protein